ncbi:protein LONGIFOLIA 1 [Cicer arietinum]|uniref:Protein LONGIFOLIA 1-like n=1 Tax=Cicer arietinum TaxID=3827 RepID=A0A1S2XJC5_CICAR|nr:protein LONGIFOLIA 1-like [Cicer arietinum]
MSKKGLTSMKDENQELQKQIGCISGFFQLFERHRFLTGQSNSHNLPNKGGTSNNIKELNNSIQKAKAKNLKVARENQQSSTESSSGTSMSSSSCSSSMSSLEFNRTIQIEPPSISPMKITENSTSEAVVKQLGNQRRQSLDFQDIVKDSMRVDAQRLSVKTLAKEEKKGRILKHIDSPRPMTAWDSPRLSYDGTFKSTTKHKELPRLSLDSKERSIKSFNEGMKTRNLSKSPHKVCGGSNTMVKQMEEQETPKRTSSVVAKLMGIEAFPDWTENCDTCNTNKVETFAGSRMSDEYTHQQDSTFQRTSQGSQLQTSMSSESSKKVSNRSLSVYGEIEKRMANLEFEKSGKDLRALKQILEAMHRYKESLDTTSDQASNSPYDNRSNSSVSESLNVQSPRTRQKNATSVSVERSNSTQGSKSPIIIMKPAKVARKTNNSCSTEMSNHGKSSGSKIYRSDPTDGTLVDKLDRQTTKGSPAIKHVKDPISQPLYSVDKSKKMRTSKLMQSSKVPQVINRENNTNSSIMAETKSPRLQKKFGYERRSPPTSPSSDFSSNRRQQNKQSTELSSPNTTSKQKFSTLQERNENFNSNYIQLKGLNENNVEKDFSKEIFMVETIVTAEQPSPVSVLDATFYREDPPSPVKRKSDISKDLDEVLNTYDSSEENSEDLVLSSNTKVNFSNGTSDIDLKTHNLVQILQQFEEGDDERFNKDPDHKYISEILLASGLLTSTSSIQALHSSGYLINPMMFLVLEEIKKNKMHFNIAKMNNNEKNQRKLIFDVVNEILVQKLMLESSCQPYRPEGRKPEGQQVLDMLCTEIDKLQHKNFSLANEDENLTTILCEDLAQHSTIKDCYKEMPNIVLDIERLIFKDLITEVVRTEK